MYWAMSARITIEGSTSLAFSEDVPARFAGLGWAVQHVVGRCST
jgi:transketolase